jgi:hypothetical protein
MTGFTKRVTISVAALTFLAVAVGFTPAGEAHGPFGEPRGAAESAVASLALEGEIKSEARVQEMITLTCPAYIYVSIVNPPSGWASDKSRQFYLVSNSVGSGFVYCDYGQEYGLVQPIPKGYQCQAVGKSKAECKRATIKIPGKGGA